MGINRYKIYIKIVLSAYVGNTIFLFVNYKSRLKNHNQTKIKPKTEPKTKQKPKPKQSNLHKTKTKRVYFACTLLKWFRMITKIKLRSSHNHIQCKITQLCSRKFNI